VRYVRLVAALFRAAAQQQLADRADFAFGLLQSILNLGAGIIGLAVLFGQVRTLRGWDFPATLALLGTYLLLRALYGLAIGPSLDGLAGVRGDVYTGRFDFTLLRPVNVQFLSSAERWHPLALLDAALGAAVLVVATGQLGRALDAARLATFLVALMAGAALLYALALACATLVFWLPGLFFTWLFDIVFELARFPAQLYPPWTRLVLTSIIPIAVITTVPAQALTGTLHVTSLAGAVALAGAALVAATMLFRRGLRRYASASS